MSRQPRFEELDEDAEDPDELDLPDFGGPSSSTLSRNDFPQPSTGGLPPSAAAAGGGFNRPQMISQETLEQYKNWPCVYPVYFDASRSLQEGRRVPLKFAVKNPLAKELASAAASLNIRSIFEPNKTHPKDWANPGRIRIELKTEDRRNRTNLKSKRALYTAMAKYLQANPTTPEKALEVQIPGMTKDKPPPPPAIPKGWKINEILPVYSPALSGGGVSDNLMRDLMREEQGVAAEPSTAAKKKAKKK